MKYDLVVIGTGPAGMTAGIYGVRADMKVLMLDRLAPGGRIVDTYEIENYPGAGKINGADLAMDMFQHTQELGVDFEYATVTEVELDGEVKKIHTEELDEVIEATTVIIASGSSPRKLGVPGEEDLVGKSVSWCAICDGAKYRDQDVVVVGGGNSAIDEGTYLAGITNSLTIVTDFDLTGDPVSAEYLRNLDNVTVYPYKDVQEFVLDDEGELKGVKFADKETGENPQMVEADGVFEYIGAVPQTQYLEGTGIDNFRGYVEADDHMRTNIPGVFVAGDCRSKHLRQIATAVSDGAIAAQEASSYIKDLKRA